MEKSPKFIRGDICFIPKNLLNDLEDNHMCTFICYNEDNAVFFLHRIEKIWEWRKDNFDLHHENFLAQWEKKSD